MLEVLARPTWVDTKHSLHKMIEDIASQPRVAVDTESNSLHAFREQVCLLQFSTSTTDYLVDPFAIDDLSSLGPIFSNPKIEKIFHAAEYDLICLRRDFSFSFSNIFDTMQAARVLGYKAVGLDKLLADKFGVRIDKKHQKANWAARPLPEAQIQYAMLDTHYLADLRDALEKDLIEKERLGFALEDFKRLCNEETKTRANGESWERFSGRKDLSLRELTIISYLCKWRDKEAERLNRPPYKVIMDDAFIALAKTLPKKKVDLSAAGLSEKQIRLWGDVILEAVKRGVESPLVHRKQTERKQNAVLRRLEKLKAWRKNLGLEMRVESDIVLPKPYLALLSENPPKNLEDLSLLMKDSPARFERFGSQILKALGVKHAN